ncbi:ThiJ/PfpI [Coprinopsis sp. MPI-PUGE-AT-0042]|nr:ThiJ/PfpI [Coprinopsis sp. MPI-PUGE-AT-0042]
MPSVLFVFTSANKTLSGAQTGWYLPEAAHPYYELVPHASIDFAAPNGANPPIDEGSVKAFEKDDLSVKFLNDDTVKQKLASALKLSDVDVSKYHAVFYVGGHGPVLDLASDSTNGKLVSDFWNSGKIVSAVCHGPAALVGGVDSNGKSIFEGRSFTGFSNKEEEMVEKVKGESTKRPLSPGVPKVVVDGRLITGQNPASAAGVGEALVKALKQ